MAKKYISQTPKQPEPEILEPIYKVSVNYPRLRKRSEPSFNSMEIGLITDKGVYDIYKEDGIWGQLEDKSWIDLEFTIRQK